MALLFPLWLISVAQVFFFQQLAGTPIPIRTIAKEMLSLYVAMFGLAPMALWAARKCPFDAPAWKRNLAQHVFILAIFGSLDYLIERTLFLVFQPGYASDPGQVLSRLTFRSHSLEGWLATLSLASPFYILTVVAYYAFNYHHDIQERALKSAQLEAQYSQSKLQTLKSQLQPHFLFNSLNAIYSYIPPEAETARRMVLLLSSFLRRSLQEIGLQKVKLRQEVEFVTLYLEIQQLRFSNRLQVVWDVGPDALDQEVPHLILQPLVENAIKHGLGPKVDPGTLWIQASTTNANLCLSVQDDGIGLQSRGRSEKGAGVGLSNTRKRLHHLYGDAAVFDCGERNGGGFQVMIQIPLQKSDRSQTMMAVDADGEP